MIVPNASHQLTHQMVTNPYHKIPKPRKEKTLLFWKIRSHEIARRIQRNISRNLRLAAI